LVLQRGRSDAALLSKYHHSRIAANYFIMIIILILPLKSYLCTKK